mgnify:CR=1 FL=1
MNRKLQALIILSVVVTSFGTIANTGTGVAVLALAGAATGYFARVLIHRVPLMMHSPDPGFTLFSPRLGSPATSPLTELLFTLSAVLLACLLPQLSSALMALLLLLLLWSLAIIDIRDGLLPDMLTQPLVWSGLLCCVVGLSRISLDVAVAGAATGWLSLWLVSWLMF